VVRLAVDPAHVEANMLRMGIAIRAAPCCGRWPGRRVVRIYAGLASAQNRSDSGKPGQLLSRRRVAWRAS